MANPAIGQTLLDQFYVEAFIDSGGMGAIFRVRDLKRNVYLAMKTLHSELAEDASIFKRFKREANALSKLTHPNIVRTYGLFHTLDFAFLLEDYIDGMSLKELLKQRQGQPLTTREVMTIMKALTSALGFAHANGVVHCDIKPGNVMLDRSGRVFLTDFGIARHADSTTTTLAHAGAPAYMSPEQILGKSVNAATDIYSLGILLYEVITGKKPFSGEEQSTSKGSTARAERLRFAHLKLAPPDPRIVNPHIPEELARVILRALEKDPRKRYQNVQAFFKAVTQAAKVDVLSISDRLSGFDIPKQKSPSIPAPRPSNTAFPLGLAGIGFAVLLMIFIFMGINRPQSASRSIAQEQGYSAQDVEATIKVSNVSTQPTSNPNVFYTQAAKTVMVSMTQTAVANPPAPTSKPANSPTQQVKREVQPTAIKTMTHCAGAPPPRMKLGDKGRVYNDKYPDEPLRLRSEPGRNMDTGRDTFIMNLNQNTRFTVIGGPVCTGPYVWWQIRTRAGDEGWAAEGDNENYYMEPFNW